MDKFTLFELHVHDGMEFSATNTAPALGRSKDVEYADLSEDELDELDEDELDELDAGEGDDEDDAGSSGRLSPLTLLLGVLALAVLAFAVRKLRGGDAELEIAELDDLTDEVAEAPDGEEAEH